MTKFRKSICAILALAFLSGVASAQWPESAAENLLICNHPSEQVLPKIGSTSDGGCYVCWFDLASGNYDVYLQRLNGDGVIQWQTNGLLLSNHPQDTWLTDYDMTVDATDHAIVTMNDIRDGVDRDIFAYRISPDGSFVWGPDGVTVSGNDGFEPDPRVCVTSEGNVVLAWQEEVDVGNVIHVRKLSPAGVDLWTPAVVTLTSTFGLSIPRIVPAEDDGVILQYLVHQGTQFWSPKFIHAQLFDAEGDMQWPDTGVVVSNAGGLGPQMKPDILPDGFGGAYSYWYDSHSANQLHVFAQHILSDGNMEWTANGVQVSLAANELQMSPTAAFTRESGHLFLFYQISNVDQSVWGIGGQMLSPEGNRQWTDNGVAFVPLGQPQQLSICAVPLSTDAVVVYQEYITGGGMNSLVKGFRADSSGELVWPNSPRTLCSVASEKSRMAATVNNVGQSIAVWPDHRFDAGDIYLQNVNPDGSLGPLGGQPPEPFSLIEPQDGDTAAAYEVPFMWHASSDPDGGEIVSYDFVLHAWWPDHNVRIAGLTDTTHVLTWEEITGQPEHDWMLVDWYVQAISTGDTTRSTEVWQFVIPEEGAARDLADLPASFALHPAFPNPFNSSTTITFDLAAPANVRLAVFNVSGREVAEILRESMETGRHTVRFDATGLSSGLYLYRLNAGHNSASGKMLLLR
jgi:hypothetical protein